MLLNSPSYARLLEYSRSDIEDILFDMAVRDEKRIGAVGSLFQRFEWTTSILNITNIQMADGDQLGLDL